MDNNKANTLLNNPETENLNLIFRRYIVLVLENWYIIAIALLLAFIYAFTKNRYAYKKYGVYTSVLVKKQNTNPEVYAGGLFLYSSKNLEDEMGFLKSYSASEKAINKIKNFFEVSYYLDKKFAYDPELYKTTPFIVKFDTSKPQYNGIKVYVKFTDTTTMQIKIPDLDYQTELKVKDTLNYKNFKFTIIKSKNFTNKIIGETYHFIKNNLKNIILKYSNILNIEPRSPNSSILWLWLESTTPEKDIDYLNSLVEVYINKRLEEKNEIALRTLEFIDNQLKNFSDSLKSAEDKLQIFKQQNLINLSDEGKSLFEEIKILDEGIRKEKVKLEYYKYMLTVVENNDQEILVLSPSILGYEDMILENYLKELSDAIYEKQVLHFTVKKGSKLPPSVISDMKIQNLIKTIKEHIKQTITYTESSIKNLQKQMKEIENKVKKLPAIERQYIQINREFDINNEIYTFLLQRRMEAGITLASNIPDVQIIDKARKETVSFKGRQGGANYFKIIFVALILSVIIIFFKELLRFKVEDKLELERLINIPIIATIPQNTRNTDLPTYRFPKSSISEAFRLLRTNLQYILATVENKIIVVSSTISGEGKTFIAANLASIIAQGEKKILLIGLDMRKPRIHKLFHIPNKIGISNYLAKDKEIEEIITPIFKNLDIIVPGPNPPNPAELIESNRMKNLLNWSKENYDIIIIDTPPIGIVADALLLSDYAKIFLYIIRQKYSSKNSVRVLREIISNSNLEHVYIVFNGVKMDLSYSIKYGYGYGYGYGYSQDYYDDISTKKKKLNFIQKIFNIFNKKQ